MVHWLAKAVGGILIIGVGLCVGSSCKGSFGVGFGVADNFGLGVLTGRAAAVLL